MQPYQFFTEKQSWVTIGKDTQYVVKETDDTYYIAFCGSNSNVDWKTNFNFFKKPYKNMKVAFHVHRGYLKEWQLIHHHFRNLVHPITKPIVVVGHSYGGAIATLCMEDLWFHYPDKRSTLSLVTFGAPRVIGWYNYKKIKDRWFDSTMYSNQYDLVSHVPFAFMGFRHVKKLTVLGKSKSFTEKLKMIHNHLMPQYRDQLDPSAKSN